jgi:serine/threonine protein phosphatase PrpC
VWRTVGASVTGTSHDAMQTRCQDHSAHALVDGPDGTALVIAVADGAGSAPASFHGAKTAVESALAYFTAAVADGRALDAADVERCFAASRENVLAVAAEYEHAARDYASTLLIVVATAETTLIGQVGDGAVVVDDGTLRIATWPQQGEYANTTHFLVDDDALERLVTVETGSVQRIAVLSDGLQALALQYDTKTPYEPFFAPFFDYLETSSKDDADVEDELRAYLESGSVNARTDDDKSLVLAVRR